MYTWEYNEDEEVWRNGEYDTIEQCIMAAKEDNPVENKDAIFIGEVMPFVPMVDEVSVLDSLEEQAGEECGVAGFEWDSYDWENRGELQELNDALTKVVHQWLKKYERYPDFYRIVNVKRYNISD